MGGAVPPVSPCIYHGSMCRDKLMARTYLTHCHNVTSLYMPDIFSSKKEEKKKGGGGARKGKK